MLLDNIPDGAMIYNFDQNQKLKIKYINTTLHKMIHGFNRDRDVNSEEKIININQSD